MHLKIGDITLADDSDNIVKACRLQKPQLKIPIRSVDIIGTRYARNSSGKSHGISFEFSAEVVRQFQDYKSAEAFVLGHFTRVAGGLQGTINYKSWLGASYGFENGVLESVEVVGEVGISLTIKYTFVTGAPMTE